MGEPTDENLEEQMSKEAKLQAAILQLKAANQQLRATEQELRKSRQQYKTTFEGSINAIAVYDAVDDGSDFVLRNFNPSAENTEKVKREDVLGKSVLQVLPTVTKFGLFDVFQTVFKTGEPQHHLETMHKDGSISGWRENYVFKLPTGQIVVIYEDITKRKRAEQARAEEHNLLRTLIDNLPDSIYVKDANSRFVIGNIGVAHIMGLETPDEMIGKTDMDFHPKELASKYYADEQQIIRSGRPLINREERVINQQKGQPIWNLVTKVPWRDSGGEIVGIVGIGRDITARKQAEEALGAANQQLNASNQQFNAANQQLKAANQQLRANEEELKQLNQDLGERVKEINCLYGLSQLVERDDITLEEIFQGLAELIPPAWQYPEITAARVNFEGQRFKTNNFRETACLQSADIKVHGQKAGSIEVCYLKKRPVIDEGPFLKEERNLLNALAERLGYIVEREQAEEQLKAANQQLVAEEQQLRAANQQIKATAQQLRAANQQLSAEEQQLRAANQQLKATEQELRNYQAQLKSLASQLSLAEERERQRIAAELHDRISQSLVISKVKLDALCGATSSKELIGNLKEIRNSLDQTIQDTRSLTFDLSSPILYELGFEAAVAEWLNEQVEQKHGIATEFEDDELPKPLDESVQVLLFRDVRELLVNVIKHARARKVKVSITKLDDTISVSVKDDGVGFDPDKIGPTLTKTGGFGLFSIRERLEQLGGQLEIESRPGHGSKLTMIAPLKSDNNTGERQL